MKGAHSSEGTNPPSAPEPTRAPWVAGAARWGSFVAAGGLTGLLVARLIRELLPLSGPLAISPALACWTWQPLLPAFCLLAGALALPMVLSLLGCGIEHKARVRACLWPVAWSFLYLVQPLRLPFWGVAALVAGLCGTFWLCARTHPGSQKRRERTRSHWTWLGDALVFLLALALYLSTLAPSVLPGDSGEFQFVAPTLGIPHPTGYPLYLLLGKLISLLPVGSVAYRLNLLSALAGAGAVWAIYRASRALGLRAVAAMLGAGLLAVSSTLWSQATIAEKYTFNAFFVALTLWLGLQWRRSHLEADRVERRWLYAWAVCYGLSLTHHRTMLVLAPAYALLLWTTDGTLVRDRRLVPRLLLLLLAPLSLYLLLPLFSALNPPYAYQRIDSVQSFFDLVLARAYQGLLFRGSWRGLGVRLVEAGRLLVRQFGWPGLVVSVLGLGAVARRARNVAVALLLGMAAQSGFALNYYVPNTFVYYLPVYVWLAVCAAAGVDVVLGTAKAVTTSGASDRSNGFGRLAPHLSLACVLLAGAWVVHLASARWAGMDQERAYRQQAFDYQYGRMAARLVEDGALIIGDWMPATVLWYTQTIEEQLPGAQVTVADPLDSLWQGPVEAALAVGRPVYLARPVMGAGERYALSSAGPLVQVLGERRFSAPELGYPVAVPGVADPLPAGAGSTPDEIVLLGANLAVSGAGAESKVLYDLAFHTNASVLGGGVLHATLVWQARRAPEGDHAVQVRWVDASGRVWLEQQNRHPVGGSYPTSRWQPGEVVSDYYALALPAYLAEGDYFLEAALGLPGSDPSWLPVAALHLLPASDGMPTWGQVRKDFGTRALTGYDAPLEWVPGEKASLVLQWLVCYDLGLKYNGLGERIGPRVWLVYPFGAQRAAEPDKVSRIAPSQAVEWYRFTIGDDLSHVEVRNKGPFGVGEVRFRLPVRVSESAPGANFDNKVRLRDAAYGAAAYRPGETVQLTLEWEAMRAMDEAYKVFVHVLGPNGLPIAQQDNEPLNGTHPTNRWQQGERVSDPYAVTLPGDLPPGEYVVEVGLYRISDLTRLPLLDAEQNVLDDKLYLEPLVIR